MTMMKTSKTILGTIALVCALSTGALADSVTTDATTVAVDAESLKKFLEDQPKSALLVIPATESVEPSA